MSLNTESLSSHDKSVLLVRLANELTVCARLTYEVGTDRLLQPELLRAYNELLHRITNAARDQLLEGEGYSMKDILEMLRSFGEKNGQTGDRMGVKTGHKAPLTSIVCRSSQQMISYP